jgi:hypothetical protein
MEPHDDFFRRLFDAAGETGIDAGTLARHAPILRRCVPDDDVLVSA